MNDQPQCTREDLRIVLNEPHYWGVHDNGTTDLDNYEGSGGESNDFDSYYCDSCSTFYTAKSSMPHHVAQAWQEALDHLNAKEVA